MASEADLLEGIRCNESMLGRIIQKKDSVILKFTEQDKILGCVRLLKNGNALFLGMLTVSPQLQGKGIGKKLLQASEDEARKTACNNIQMRVISVRTELVDWYVRHGYKDTGIREPFETSTSVSKMPLELMILEKQIA